MQARAMNQNQRIQEYLDSGGVLTRIDSWAKLGMIEAPARISELRKKGYAIKTTMITVTNRYGEKVRVAEWRKDDGR